MSRVLYSFVSRAIKHILAALEPHRKENGGVLSVEHIRLVKCREPTST